MAVKPADGGKKDASAPTVDQARDNILSCLGDKVLSLNSIISELDVQLLNITNTRQRERVLRREIAATSERDLCLAREQQIHADKPFTDPGETAEKALRAAIAQVDQALANTNAIADLLSAADGLIKAYKAKQTQAA